MLPNITKWLSSAPAALLMFVTYNRAKSATNDLVWTVRTLIYTLLFKLPYELPAKALKKLCK